MYRIFDSIVRTKDDFFGYKYDKEHENRVKYHWILKYAYFSWIVNMIMCFLLPMVLRHSECRKGLSWWAHGIFGGYLIMSFNLEIFLFFYLTDA